MLKRTKPISKKAQALRIIKILQVKTKDMPPTMSIILSKEYNKDPFVILISCLLSLRSRDIQTLPVSRKLFELVRSPQELLNLPDQKIEEIIYKLGYYRQKTRILKSVCRELIDRFASKVPQSFEDLLSIKGIGPKTANLVMADAYNEPAICVDTHVHRLANLFGLVNTKTPAKTEIELKKIVPQEYWREINQLFVVWGQNTGRGKKSTVMSQLILNK